jgi:hypothetical protein
MNIKFGLHTCLEDQNKNNYCGDKWNCNMMTVMFWQRNMDFIKTEPGPDAELYPASCIENQLIDVKVEEKPLFITLPLQDAGNDVSCLSACY